MNQPNLLLLGLGFFLVFFYGRRLLSNSGAKTIKAKLAAGATVLDVRTQEEYRSGHYGSALNIPLDQLQSQPNAVAKKTGGADRPVLVYCASGSRSAMAVRILKAAGYTDVHNAGSLRRLQCLA